MFSGGIFIADDIGLRVHELEVGQSGSDIKPGDKVTVRVRVLPPVQGAGHLTTHCSA